MKTIIFLIALILLTTVGKTQEKNEAYFHADYPGFAGAAYGKNIGKIYSGAHVHVDPFRGRNKPEFTGNLELGVIVLKQFVLFGSGGFYTCGGEAKREGEGKQGYAYGGGICAYYQKKKLQLELTSQTARISFGWFVGWGEKN